MGARMRRRAARARTLIQMPAATLILTVSLLAAQAGAAAQPPADRLAGVKALFAAADYEAALIVLSTDDVASIPGADQYRALCLLALGRLDDVDRLLETLIRRDPTFNMSISEVTPRMIALFRQTRQRLLPGILDDRFKAAKTSFEQGRHAEAAVQFKALLTLLADEDAMSGEGPPASRDMQRVAEGFLNLSSKALAESAKPAAPPPAPVVGDRAAAPPLEKVDDETAIARVVQAYAKAYSERDADAVARVFQGENPKPLHAMFDALKSQTVDARALQIALDPGGWSATVTLNWVVQAVPKVGSSRKTQTPATLRMLKVVTGEWYIVARR
jgi:ketosteroid isomerase-like protein